MKSLLNFARFSDEADNLTRLSLSPAHKQAQAHLKRLFQEAGLSVRSDGLGSVIGRLAGASPKTLHIGSHSDTVKNAGLYDGNLGIFVGLEAIKALKHPLNFSLELHAFADEEGVRFPSTLSNSRLLAGQFNPKILDECDENGVSRRDALLAFGEDVTCITPYDTRQALGYLEIHIEQGPVLEAANAPLGVVTAINGATRGSITLKGKAGHAGTLPMNMRQDALTAAAEIILAIETYANATPDLVATIGTLTIPHAAVNVVAGEVRFSLDMRSPKDAIRQQAAEKIRQFAQEITTKRGIQAEINYTYHANAAPCDTRLQAHLSASLANLGLPVVSLPSGAGHDAMAFKDIMPQAMLFVRSKDGVSHHPDEFTSEDDIALAVDALALTLQSLNQSYGDLT